MSNVTQYTSRGEYVKVLLKDGTNLSNVIICPDPLDPHSSKHILEKPNGDIEYVRTVEIEGVYRI